MSRILMFAMILVVFICVIGAVSYLYFAKREERKTVEKQLEHEREMRLDEQLYSDDTESELELEDDDR